MAPCYKIHALGSLSLTFPNNKNIEFSAGNSFLLLFYLHLTSEKISSRERLAYIFYPDNDLDSGRQNLRQLIHRLKSKIKDGKWEHELIITDRDNIQLNPVCDVSSDIEQFVNACDAVGVHAHRRPQVCNPCMHTLEKAVDLAQGGLLKEYDLRMDYELGEFIHLFQSNFQERYQWALLQLIQHHSLYKQTDKLQKYLNLSQELDPLNEIALRAAMQMDLDLEGRNKALRRYNQFRDRLHDQLGVEPEKETMAFVDAIASGACKKEFEEKQAAVSKTLKQIREQTNNPIDHMLSPLYGRKELLQEIAVSLASKEERIINLKGLVGAGKTRLMAEAVRASYATWQDGVRVVKLPQSSQTRENLILVLMRTLQLPADRDMSENVERLIAYLHDKEMLLLIDHYETNQISTNLLSILLRNCYLIKILVTSQTYLGIQGEKVISVEGLNYPREDNLQVPHDHTELDKFIQQYSALQLFVDAAKRVDHQFSYTSNDIADMVKVCDFFAGLPLGIELAASYIRLFKCREIYDNLILATQKGTNQSQFISQRHASYFKRFRGIWDSLSDTERNLVTLVYSHPEGVRMDAFLNDEAIPIETFLALQEKSTLVRDREMRVKVHPLVSMFINAY